MAFTPPGETRNKIFEYVKARLLAGEAPSVREVQEHFGFQSVGSAREHLEALVREGLLRKQAGKARGYRLPESDASRAILVPLLGRVQAGALTTAVEDLEGYVSVQSRSTQAELFALRVRGESMIRAAILPGDIVIVRRQPSANGGDVVVALVDDEATVKRLRFVDKRVELHPENPEFEPIRPTDAEVHILGKVIEVRRYLETTVFSE
jgi:repressor LexA